MRHVTGAPVVFVGMGEKVGDLQEFHADRLVSRVLGMGDVVSLVEKAQDVVDEKEAEDQMQRMMQDRFTLEDFLKQLRAIRKMGSLGDLMGHLPGMPAGMADQIDDKMIRLESPLKEIGVFDVAIHLHADVETTTKVWVVQSKPE